MRPMDYDDFKDQYGSFDNYMKQSRKDFILSSKELPKGKVVKFGKNKVTNDDWMYDDLEVTEDRVDHPSHYTHGSQEAIVTIEEAIDGAPSVQTGMLQAQVLKYLLRVWYKDNPLEDLKKARWYLTRLIEKLQ